MVSKLLSVVDRGQWHGDCVVEVLDMTSPTEEQLAIFQREVSSFTNNLLGPSQKQNFDYNYRHGPGRVKQTLPAVDGQTVLQTVLDERCVDQNVSP